MLKKLVACILSLVFIGAFLTGCANKAAAPNTGSSTANGTIWFAVVGPMTGNDAAEGVQQERGVRLAVNEINAAGGINGKMLAYDVFDDQRATDQSIICAQKIVAANKYLFVVAPIATGCSKAAYPIYAQADLPLVSGSNTGSDITHQGFKNYLRISSPDSKNLEQIMDLMVTKGVTKPAILYSSADTDVQNEKQAVDYFKTKYNLTPVDTEEFQADTDKDFSTYATTFKSKNVDGVLFLAEYDTCGLYLKQKLSLGFDAPTFTTSGCANDLIFQIAPPDAFKGFYSLTAFDPARNDPRVQKFVQDYQALAGVNPSELAAGAYDVIYIFKNALANPDAANLTGNKLVEWIRANTNYQGIMEDVKGFDANGDNPTAKCEIFVVNNGKFVTQ